MRVIKTCRRISSRYDDRPIAPIPPESVLARKDDEWASLSESPITLLEADNIGSRKTVVVREYPYCNRPSVPSSRMLHQVDHLILGQVTAAGLGRMGDAP
jgi:hypothetical protein